ncbi:MAG: hypothetical protein GF329_16115 [Candidatus Lokiarchaeota archaeon]|nr:hypothetical protein [Candidatus Lokiarchaeota archaeon]
MKLKVNKSKKIIPSPVKSITKYSIFENVISAIQCEEFKQVNLNRYDESIFKIISLDGLWRRKADFGNLYNYPYDKDYDDFNWPQVMVPDNFGLDGELQRHYYPVWYRREFKISLDKEIKPYIDLVFESVDYLADIWLNNWHLGHHEGYFAPFQFDITNHLEEINNIAVKVQDPSENLKPWTFFTRHYKKYIKGTFNYHDSRPGGLPGRDLSPKWSSEWGQSLPTGGITQSVYLKFIKNIRIDAIFITPLDLLGNLHIAVILENKNFEKDSTSSEIKAYLNFSVKELFCPTSQSHTFSIEVDLKNETSRIDFEIQIPEPKLWSSDTPNLYQLKVEAIHDNILSDVKKERFGIRTIRLDTKPWQFYLNDKQELIKAVNYIPIQHFAGVDESFYDRDAIIIKEAHCNSVGIHAHVQSKDCYTSFDRNGLLIFQDFPLQWSYDSSVNTNPGFREKACQQISEMGYLLYNHPSVVYYCCHNEPAYVFEAPNPDPVDDRDNSILDLRLQETLKEICSMRPVHKASGVGDDLHIYDGSIGGGSIYDVRKRETGFVSEFGFWSVGEGASKWGDIGWPPTEKELLQWASRFGFFASTKTFIGHPNVYTDRNTWIRSSQLYGAFLAKYQTEYFRSKKELFKGIRWHFFSDWWGYAGGGLVDVERTPKLPYFWYKKALRPLLLMIDIFNTIIFPGTELELQLLAINDLDTKIEVSWELELNQVNGSIVIAADPIAAGTDGTTGPPAKKYHKIAIPIDGLTEDTGHESKIIKNIIKISNKAILKPRSIISLKSINFPVPETDEHNSYTFSIRWKQPNKDWDTNWTHFIVGKKRWRIKPGLHYIFE